MLAGFAPPSGLGSAFNGIGVERAKVNAVMCRVNFKRNALHLALCVTCNTHHAKLWVPANVHVVHLPDITF